MKEDGLAGAHLEQLAPPLPFGHLGLLVLGDHALHLDQQPSLRVVIEGRRVGEAHLDAEAGQLVEDEHLVGEVAGQPVGGEHPHPFEEARLGLVAQGVEAGTVQAGAGVSVVDEAGRELVADLDHSGFEHGDLRVDGSPIGLCFRRHSGVDGRSH